MESDLELSGLCDITRLCLYWKEMLTSRDGVRTRTMLLGYLLLTSWHRQNGGIEAQRDVGLLLDIADYLEDPDFYKEAA